MFSLVFQINSDASETATNVVELPWHNELTPMMDKTGAANWVT